MSKAPYVVSGVGPGASISKALNVSTVYDGAIVNVTPEDAKRINATADAYEERNPHRTALRVTKAKGDVLVQIVAGRAVEEIAALAASKTPEERVADLVDAHSRSELEDMARELGIDEPEKRANFGNMTELATAIVGAGPDPT